MEGVTGRAWVVWILVGVAVCCQGPGALDARTVRAPVFPVAQDPQSPATPIVLTPAEQEVFLAKARIVRTRSVSKGVTGTIRATLSDGRVTHDASIQTVDQYKARFEGARGVEFDFRDSWRYNVAAYRLDRLLDLGMTPVSVERRYDRAPAAFTWWVDDVLMDEGERLRTKTATPDARRWNEQMWHVRLFDQLIDNVDRNMGNLLIDTDWRIWMIDHSRSFRLLDAPRRPANITRCDRTVFERLEALDAATLTATMGRYLTPVEIKALLKRRDAIVQHLQQSGVLFDWDRPERPGHRQD
jgi:hypothetical protein